MVRIVYDYLSVDIIGLINFIFCVCPFISVGFSQATWSTP